MQLSKKLIICSVVAIIVGISSVVPLVFLMTPPAKAEATSGPWFSIDLPYSYWVTSDGPLTDLPWEAPWDNSGLNETNSVSEQHMVTLNITLNVDPTIEPIDARVEYYNIDVSSDKGLIETMNFVVGTNSNSSFSTRSLLGDFHFMRNDWFDTDTFDPMTYGGGGGLAVQDWVPGVSKTFPEGGSGMGTLGGSSTSRTVTALREAETVYVSIYRVGWVTFSGNSTTVTTANNELIDQIQLEKYGEEGWIYNDLIPEDELAETDLLNPISYE